MQRASSVIPFALLTTLLLVVGFSVRADASSFTDVPPSRADYQAIEYLRQQQVLRGYDDGTFRPDTPVSRAEAVKILIASKLSGATLATTSPFTDVPQGAWYLPSVERARTLGIIAGPPAKPLFRPADPVLKCEFLQMFFKVEGIDPVTMFSDLPHPLATDVRPADWFFPSMRLALASSMITINTQGSLTPGEALTRGNVASLLYRDRMYQLGRRSQALLSEAESDMVNLLQMFDQTQLEQAEFASARALVAARGALEKNPTNAVVQGAVKIAEGFWVITQAFRAGTEKRLDDVIAQSKEAWSIAEGAKKFGPSLSPLALQIQTIAKKMADNARTLKASQ